ncbi:hypothetical protein NBH00_02310 [Paraconexibacter antarcticus]|uniref:Carboxypeptidase regulatory-like domain-containing protein n=1 Tax=Paraconexibacter antarcticus TaxID=2949664 RepID=A0ABY5DTP6_9ACTN|nr:hypothetical protein [Paraconexibacter antarcticus]UTI65051.1 hypothetical protein NBH00_02310 [Paraconexibacter antarcticus]
MRLDLTDDADPVITAAPAGSLVTATNTDRERTLTYSASDQGGGLYQQRLMVDGSQSVVGPVNDNGGKCALPFRDPVPCRTTPVTGSVTLDTTSLDEGKHLVRLEVVDATGVNKAQSPQWSIMVDNKAPFLTPAEVAAAMGAPGAAGAGGPSGPAGPAGPGGSTVLTGTTTITTLSNPDRGPGVNGRPSTLDAVVTARLIVGTRGHAHSSTRAVVGYVDGTRVRGTLRTSGGDAIAAARVHVIEKPIGAAESHWHAVASATTDDAGAFVVPLAARGRSRDVRVVYFPTAGANANRSSGQLSLQVRQDASLRVSRRALRNGDRLALSGRVAGLIPARGLTVRVQVRLGRSWFTFAKATTTRARGGRFVARHRFTKTTHATTYRFRALVLPGDRRRYASGHSRTIAVRVRP